MKMNENEWKWMKMNENEWKWMKMNENEWKNEMKMKEWMENEMKVSILSTYSCLIWNRVWLFCRRYEVWKIIITIPDLK